MAGQTVILIVRDRVHSALNRHLCLEPILVLFIRTDMVVSLCTVLDLKISSEFTALSFV